jgi:flagella basal body P-ring formation protein FlgA
MIAILTTTLLAGITIVLPMEAPVRGSEIELGEIATIQGASPEQLALLESLEIAGAPTPGYSRVLDRNDIHMRVRRVLPDVDVRYSGRSVCRVYPETHVVTGADLQAAVDARLVDSVGGRDITWAPRATLGALEVPIGTQGEPELDVLLGSPVLVTGLLPVTITIKVDGLSYRKVWANWDVTVWETLPVLTRSLPAGTQVSPAHFELRRTALPDGPREAILSPASMVGVVAKRNLVEGSLVLDTDVDRPTILHQGDAVILEVKKGSIRAQVQVLALETGSVGDTVRVRRLDNEKELHAVVRSRKLVQLDLDA